MNLRFISSFIYGFNSKCIFAQDEPEISEREKKKQTIEETQKSLPIYPFKEDLIAAMEEHQVLIIEGETGSGKTTQIPQYLVQAVSIDREIGQGR